MRCSRARVFAASSRAVVDLAAADADVLQFPVAELAQRSELRLTLVTRNRRGNQAINEAAQPHQKTANAAPVS